MARKGRGHLDTYFASSNGAEVKLRPVPMLALQMIRTKARAELVARGVKLEPPTYTVDTAAGEKETYPHDETTLQTDEDRAAWAEYQEGSAQLNQLISERVARLVLKKGLDIPPLDDKTAQEWADLGVEFSTEAEERYIEQIQLVYLPTPADMQGMIKAVLLLSMSGAPKEQLDSIEELFRREVEGRPAAKPANAPGQLAV